MCNFGKGYSEEQLYEIILKLCHWFRRRCRLEDFLSGAMCPLVQWSKTSNAILKEGIIGNIHGKLCETWTSGSGGDVV